jgi:hypothetical protein
VVGEVKTRQTIERGGEQMRAYYMKVFRHMLSATVLIGFGLNLGN